MLTVAATLLVATAGTGGDLFAPKPSLERSNAGGWEKLPADDPKPVSSGYSLHTEDGPHSARVARVATGTLLLTGLALTALGAIGQRGPVLIRRKPPTHAVFLSGATRYRWNPPANPETDSRDA